MIVLSLVHEILLPRYMRTCGHRLCPNGINYHISGRRFQREHTLHQQTRGVAADHGSCRGAALHRRPSGQTRRGGAGSGLSGLATGRGRCQNIGSTGRRWRPGHELDIGVTGIRGARLAEKKEL